MIIALAIIGIVIAYLAIGIGIARHYSLHFYQSATSYSYYSGEREVEKGEFYLYCAATTFFWPFALVYINFHHLGKLYDKPINNRREESKKAFESMIVWRDTYRNAKTASEREMAKELFQSARKHYNQIRLPDEPMAGRSKDTCL